MMPFAELSPVAAKSYVLHKRIGLDARSATAPFRTLAESFFSHLRNARSDFSLKFHEHPTAKVQVGSDCLFAKVEAWPEHQQPMKS